MIESLTQIFEDQALVSYIDKVMIENVDEQK